MAKPFDPDAYLKEKTGAVFDPDAYMRAKGVSLSDPLGDANSPLRQAVTSNPRAEVVTVDTPLGTQRMTRAGDPVLDAGQSADMAGAEPKRLEAEVYKRLAAVGNGLNLAPPLAGAVGAVGAALTPGRGGAVDWGRIIDAYKATRDNARKTLDDPSNKVSPGYGIVGSVLSTGPFAPETMAGRLALGFGLGGVESAAGSRSDLLTADPIELAESIKDTAGGAVRGLAASGVGEAIGYPLRWSADKLKSLGKAIYGNKARVDQEAVRAELASLAGQLGGETQKGSRILENAQRAVTGIPPSAGGGLGSVGSGMATRATSALQSPEGQRLTEGVLSGNLHDLPQQTDVIEALRRELAAQSAGAPAEAAKRTSDYFAQPVFQTAIAPRLKRELGNQATGLLAAIPGAGLGAIGGALTGHTGTGALAGAMAGYGRGASTGLKTMTRNLLRDPLTQYGATQAVPGLYNTAADIISNVAGSVGRNASKLKHDDNEAIAAYLDAP